MGTAHNVHDILLTEEFQSRSHFYLFRALRVGCLWVCDAQAQLTVQGLRDKGW